MLSRNEDEVHSSLCGSNGTLKHTTTTQNRTGSHVRHGIHSKCRSTPVIYGRTESFENRIHHFSLLIQCFGPHRGCIMKPYLACQGAQNSEVMMLRKRHHKIQPTTCNIFSLK